MQSITQFWEFPFESRAEMPDLLMASTEDRSLRGQLARGDERAFNLVYERYQRPIYRFAWHMSGDRATAEEITQEVFMILIRRPRGYDPDKGSLGGYLFGIARNLTRRSMEQRRVNVTLVDDPNESDKNYAIEERTISDLTDALDALTQRELIASLRKAVLSLPTQYREVISLCDLQQMSQASAAELLQCSPGTVASRMHRARALLRKKLMQEGGE